MSVAEDGTFVAGLLAVMLGLALWRDVTRHRIDNWITFPGAAIALGLHLWLAGGAGLAFALGGLLIGLSALLPFQVFGGMAAGDVKLMAAAGAFLGPLDTLIAVAATLLAGSLLALGVLIATGGVREGLGHIGRQLAAWGVTRVWVPAPPGTAAAQRFPYALAISIGSLTVVAWRVLRTTSAPVY